MSLAIFVAIGNQIALGYGRQLDAHIPLGVGIFGAQTATAMALIGHLRAERGSGKTQRVRWP